VAFSFIIMRMLATFRRVAPALTASSSVVSQESATFDFSGGDADLLVAVDGGAPQTVTIHVAGMAVPAAATADEVATEIAAGLVGGTSYVTAADEVVVATNTVGAGGSVQVTGGAANAILAFPTAEVDGGGYDDVFGALRPVQGASQAPQGSRREYPAVTLPCQVDRNTFGDERLGAGGHETSRGIVIVVERTALAAAGLIRSDGTSMLQVGDRLVQVTDTGGNVQEAFADPPGVWITRVERAGFGLALAGGQWNLIYLHCEETRGES